jgi:Cdc6-like AAA superfamily ATPase
MVLLFVVAVSITVARNAHRRLSKSAQILTSASKKLEEARTGLSERLTTEVEALIRERLNHYLQDERRSGAKLYTERAPALVEFESSEPISVASLSELENFVKSHKTSAVGIAGPRGVGKTTIIHRLCTSKDLGYLGTYIQAPVYYNAADFVRFIHTEVARSVLQESGGTEIRPEVARDRRIFLFRGMLAAIAFYAGIALVYVDWREIQLPAKFGALGLVGLTLILMGLATMFSSMQSQMYARRLGRTSQHTAEDLARVELSTLGWSSSVQRKAKNVLKFFPQVSIEDEDQISLAERDRSHPERVGDFKNFLRRFQQLRNSKPLIIGIDELDKIASAEQTIEAINGLKDLFHVRDVHFLVSVSEDALHRFAVRGIPVRDVFDSAFDTVVELQRFRANESIDLLARRVVNFPDSVALLCHAISGGIPRDLIRAARNCVALRLQHGSPIALTELTEQLVRAEVLDVVEAAISRARDSQQPLRIGFLLELYRSIIEPEELSFGDQVLNCISKSQVVFQPNGHQSVEGQDSKGDSWGSLVPYLLVMTTIGDFFSIPRNATDWREGVESGELLRRVELLAKARAGLALFPSEALWWVRRARATLGLPPIEISEDGSLPKSELGSRIRLIRWLSSLRLGESQG